MIRCHWRTEYFVADYQFNEDHWK